MPVNDYLVPLVTCTLTDAIVCLDTVLICCCLLNTIIVIIIEFWDFSWSLLCYTLVSVLILGICITRGQYYWILDIGCLSWYRSNPSSITRVWHSMHCCVGPLPHDNGLPNASVIQHSVSVPANITGLFKSTLFYWFSCYVKAAHKNMDRYTDHLLFSCWEGKLFEVLVCPLFVTERFLWQPLVCGTVFHRTSLLPPLSPSSAVVLNHISSHFLILLSGSSLFGQCPCSDSSFQTL